MLPVAKAIMGHVDGLCVFEPQDGHLLRFAGVRLPVLVMRGLRNADEAKLVAQHQLWLVVTQQRDIELVTQCAAAPDRVFIKVQTGMHRLGFAPEEIANVLQALRQGGVTRLALMHHYANAEIDDGTAAQNAVMHELTEAHQLPVTASNSAATLLRQEADYEEFVRCGISVYGSLASGAGQSAASLGLRPAMSLRSEVLAVQKLAQGATVGYGSRWTASSATRLAVIACGYAHGYPRTMNDGTPVWVNGMRLPLAGQVSMEMLIVEAGANKVHVGDTVELWGQHVPVDEAAVGCGTIGYELLAGLPNQIPRKYSS